MKTRNSVLPGLSALLSFLGLMLLPSGCGDAGTMPAAIVTAPTDASGQGSADATDSRVIGPDLDASPTHDAGGSSDVGDASRAGDSSYVGDTTNGVSDGAASDRATDGTSGGLDPAVLAIMKKVAD